MDTSRLHPGDRLQANVRGLPFTCTLEKKEPTRLLKVQDPDPSWVTYRFLKPRQVVRKLEGQERLV